MHGQVADVLVILVNKASSPLDDNLLFVSAIVLDVAGDAAEGCVLEMTSEQLEKNRLASAGRPHQESGSTLWQHEQT